MAEEKFDGLFLTLAQQSQGIEPLLDNLFSFLRRKTDFFVGASPEMVEDIVLKAVKKHAELSEKEQLEKKLKKEKEEKLKQQKLEKKRKEEEAKKLKETPKEDDGILELTGDGSFDTAHLKAEPESVMEKGEETVPEEPEVDNRTEEEKEEDNTPPPPGNGGKTDKFVWTQSLSELTVNIPMPPNTKAKMLDVSITNSKLKVGLKGAPPAVDGELHKRVIVEDSFWTFEDGEVVVSLTKDNKMEWWKCVMVGDPEINTQKVQPENSKLSDLDGETRQTVEKMMFDQRQKAMGKPTADEMQKQEMLNKFMAAHPEMDFSKAKFT